MPLAPSNIKAEQTIMPPDLAKSGEGEREKQRQLELLREAMAAPSGLPVLLGLDAEPIPLPEDLFHLLRDTINALAEGFPVRFDIKRGVQVSTSQAADILGISRPTMVRFLEEGRIPFSKPGKHRRLQLADVMEFKRRITHGRQEAAADLQERTIEMYGDD
jgi:excisionase family DNA binding protein